MIVLTVVLPLAVRAEVVVTAGWETAVAAARAGVGPAGNVGLDVGQAGVERSFSFHTGLLLGVNHLVLDADHQEAAPEQAWNSHHSIIRARIDRAGCRSRRTRYGCPVQLTSVRRNADDQALALGVSFRPRTQ